MADQRCVQGGRFGGVAKALLLEGLGEEEGHHRRLRDAMASPLHEGLSKRLDAVHTGVLHVKVRLALVEQESRQLEVLNREDARLAGSEVGVEAFVDLQDRYR